VLLRLLRVGLNLLSYEFHKNEKSLDPFIEKDELIGPQERFFFFLCKRSSKTSSPSSEMFTKLFDKIVHHFDFLYHNTIEKLSVLHYALELVIEVHPRESKELQNFNN